MLDNIDVREGIMNLIKCLAWITFLLISGLLLELSREWHRYAFVRDVKTLHFLSVLMPVFIFTFLGVLLNSKRLINQFRSEGEWRLNIEKFLLLSLLPVLFIFFLELISRYMISLDKIDLSSLSVLALILFGYYLVQSLYKKRHE
jgi:hypothetical protein